MRRSSFALASAIAWIGTWLAAQACTSSSDNPTPQPDGGSPSYDGTVSDSPAPGQDTGSPADAGADTSTANDANANDANTEDSSSVNDASDAGADVGPVLSVSATVPLPDVPQRMRLNATTNMLYVMLSNAGTVGGISVVDTTSKTVVGAMSVNNDAGTPVFFDDIEVDETSNMVYGATNRKIYAFDGASNTFVGTIDLSSVSVGAPSARIYGLAADGAGKKLYAILGYWYGSQTVAVIDTSTAPGTVGPTVSLSDIVVFSDPYAQGLVIDTKNHLLFACGLSPQDGGSYLAAADTIDTTNNTVSAAQQTFAGTSLGCRGAPGFAVLTTKALGATPAQLHALEPIDVVVPFEPSTVGAVTDSNGMTYVNVYGKSSPSTTPGRYFHPMQSYDFCGEKLVRTRDLGWIDDPAVNPFYQFVWMDPKRPDINGQDIWFVGVNLGGDAGATPDIYVLHIDPPPADGGCP